MLCECRRLLQSTVGVSLDFTEIDARQRALKIISTLQSFPTLKIYKISVSGGLFEQLSFFPMNAVMEPEQYFKPFSFDHVEELNYAFSRGNTNFHILNVLIGKMSQLKILSFKHIFVATSLEKALQTSELDHVTYGSLEKIIINHEYEHPVRMWSEIIFQNMSFLCERLPNLQSIIGVAGYNERFYQKFTHLIECPVLEISDASLNILQNTELKPKKLYLYQDLSQEFDSTSLWQELNKNSTLETIRLVYDDGGVDYYENTGDINDRNKIPDHDYSKVKHLKLHYGITESMQRGSLQRVFKQFPYLTSLELRCFIHDVHFFGHEPFQLSFLESATVYLQNCTWSCDECLDSLMKSLTNVKSLRLSALDPNVIQLIGKNLPQLRELYFEWPMQEQLEDYYMVWPKTTFLEKFVFPGQRHNKIESVAHFCEMCPNIKRLELYLNEAFAEEILDVLLEKLKLLEYVKFKDCKYVVTVKDGKHCFEVQVK